MMMHNWEGRGRPRKVWETSDVDYSMVLKPGLTGQHKDPL